MNSLVCPPDQTCRHIRLTITRLAGGREPIAISCALKADGALVRR